MIPYFTTHDARLHCTPYNECCQQLPPVLGFSIYG
jgi:hypothetical protein